MQDTLTRIIDIEKNSEYSRKDKILLLVNIRNEIESTLKGNHKLFVHAYFTDAKMDATKAYYQSGGEGKNGYAIGYQLKKKPKIAAYIKATEILNRLEINYTSDDLKHEYLSLKSITLKDFYDHEGNPLRPHELPEHVASAVQRWNHRQRTFKNGEDDTVIEETFQYYLVDKVKIMESLGKHLGFHNPVIEEDGSITMKVYKMPDNGRAEKEAV